MNEISKITHAEILGIISAWFCMIGAFLPWASVDSGYVSGYPVMGFDAGAGFTLFFGTICFLLFYFGNKLFGKYKTFLGILLLGILILFIFLSETAYLSSRCSYYSYDYSYLDYMTHSCSLEYSYGYYLTFFGSIGLLFSAVWLFIDTYKSDKR